MENLNQPLVLILCTGNSARSHIAEGLLRRAGNGRIRVESAGSKPAGYVHPLAVQAMKEIGIDISGHRSKNLTEYLNQKIHTVITVCGKADEACPAFPGQMNRYHWPFDDPAHAPGTEEEKLAVFRRVRDEMAALFNAYAAGWCDALSAAGSDAR
jgi:arsenate reductase